MYVKGKMNPSPVIQCATRMSALCSLLFQPPDHLFRPPSPSHHLCLISIIFDLICEKKELKKKKTRKKRKQI